MKAADRPLSGHSLSPVLTRMVACLITLSIDGIQLLSWGECMGWLEPPDEVPLPLSDCYVRAKLSGFESQKLYRN